MSHQIVLTKADQVKRADLEACIAATEAALKEVRRLPASHRDLVAEGEGLPELRAAIAKLKAERGRDG